MVRETVKQGVQLAFEQILFTLDELGREPEPWEQVALVDALCCMASGRYITAHRKIVDVSRSVHLKQGRRKHVRVSREVLRRALTYVQIHK